MRPRPPLPVVAAWAGALLMAGTALPAGATEEAAGSATWLGLPTWVWAIGNLVVFWGLLVRYAGPYVRAFFQQRRLQIGVDLARAAEQRREAEELRRSLVHQIEALRREIQELSARGEQEAEQDRQRVLEQAERERERIVAQTAREIDHRAQQARAELVALAARLASDLARERLERELTPEDRRRVFDRNLERLKEKVS